MEDDPANDHLKRIASFGPWAVVSISEEGRPGGRRLFKIECVSIREVGDTREQSHAEFSMLALPFLSAGQ